MNELLKLYQRKLYFLGRLFAFFIFGPYLIYVGKKYHDYLLTILGVLLILWDGIKIFFQVYYNDYSY
jgi:hypothetical protein